MNPTYPAAREKPLRRIAIAFTLVVFVATALLVLAPFSGSISPAWATSASPSGDPWASFPAGWTELPHPPELRPGASIVWTGAELILWGGETPNGRASTDGFRFDPTSNEWSDVSPAPFHERYGARAAWIGSEMLIWGGSYARHGFVDGGEYNPVSDSWRRIPPAPLKPRWGGVELWTGRSFIVWGGGNVGQASNVDGATYDPATNAWHRLPDAPIGLNAATAVWTGHKMIVFGSLLNHRNRARTKRAVAEAYDPTTRSWRLLATSPLSPQASSGGWVDGRVIAWDYGVRAAEYLPKTDSWQRFGSMPLDASECYPDSAVFEGGLFAFFCGHAALFDGHSWSEARSRFAIPGPRKFEYTTGEAVGTGTAVVISEQELTVSNGGPCIGCSGAGRHLWVFRPGATAASIRFTRPEARDTARRFMNVRLYGARREMHGLLSRSGRRAFQSSSSGLHLLYKGGYKRFRILFIRRAAAGGGGEPGTSFDVGVRMSTKKGRLFKETLLIGPGRSIDGRGLDLFVNGGHGGVASSTDYHVIAARVRLPTRSLASARLSAAFAGRYTGAAHVLNRSTWASYGVKQR